MDDLISRQATIQAIDDYTKGKPLYEYPWQIIEVIKKVPSAEKTGKWIRIPYSFAGGYRCPICGQKALENYWNYCPNCGARMVD